MHETETEDSASAAGEPEIGALHAWSLRRLRLRKMRALRIARVRERISRSHVTVAAMARALARPPGDALPDGTRLQAAYAELAKALAAGEFSDAGGRSRLLLLHPMSMKRRLPSEDIPTLEHIFGPQIFRARYLEHIWIPLATARAFFRRRNCKFPADLAPPKGTAPQLKAGTEIIHAHLRDYLAGAQRPTDMAAVAYVKRRLPAATRQRIRYTYRAMGGPRLARGRPRAAQ